ncbi:DMT family transporter [Massilia horti]|uniref:DMT family transporter n=2 Tax=Massilia horti TaxID=2562153 RepID=A0A4Y9SUX2_9BURK|nr:DMT family transporter [Massilia horti]
MLVAVAFFSVMDTTMKMLSAGFPAMQVAALRCLASLPLVLVWVGWRGALRTALKVNWPLHLLRAALGIVMLALFAYGVKHLSLASAYSIFFIGPILITALSVVMLGETVNAARWLAIGVGMAGVMVVLRPDGSGLLSLGGLAILAAATCYAVSAIAARLLARTDSKEHMMFWLMLLMAAGASVLAAPNWVPVESQHLPILCTLSVSGFFAQMAINEAFSRGEASVVAPFEYSALAWGVAIDWLLWRTLPDQFTLIGASIIIGSGLYLIRHEKVHA